MLFGAFSTKTRQLTYRGSISRCIVEYKHWNYRLWKEIYFLAISAAAQYTGNVCSVENFVDCTAESADEEGAGKLWEANGMQGSHGIIEVQLSDLKLDNVDVIQPLALQIQVPIFALHSKP